MSTNQTKKVLFVCIHNSARSQMAEALLQKYGNDEFIVQSAGFEPGVLNPLAVEVMKDEDVDISNNSVDRLFDFYNQGKLFQYIITVCDEGSTQKCPIFPGVRERIHWSIEDPSTFTGTHEEQLEKTRVVKDKIKSEVLKFIELVKDGKLKEEFPTTWSMY